MAVIHLTESVVARLPAPDPSGKQTIHWDEDLKGFAVLCSGVSTAKSYVVQHQIGGKNRRITVGPVNVFEGTGGLAAARFKAKQVLGQFYTGVDPKLAGKKTTAEIELQELCDATLGEVLEDYIAAARDLRPATINGYRGAVKRHLSDWADDPMRHITPDMVEARHEFIQQQIETRWGKSSDGPIKIDGKATANGAIKTVRTLWSFHAQRVEDEARRLLRDQYRSAVYPPNPVSGRMRRRWFPSKRRTRIVPPEDMTKFYAAVISLVNPIQRDYVRVLLFTGLRRTECATLKWIDIDFVNRVIHIPGENTKTGHRLDLPMTDIVRDILVERRTAGRENEFVFPSPSLTGHLVEPKFIFDQIAFRCGIRVTAQDLRRGYITIAESADISPLALKALVNHSLGSDVTEGYVQMTAERLREPAQRIADKIKALCGIKPPTEAGHNVKVLTA